MPAPPLAGLIRQNSFLLCSVSGCDEQRRGLGSYCKTHSVVFRRYGHAEQRPIQAGRWASYRTHVRDLFAANAEHPGFKQALAWVADMLQRAAVNESAFKGAEELARLIRHGVTAETVLVEVCAFRFFCTTSPTAFRSDRAADVAMSRAVYALAPRDRRVIAGTGSKPKSYAPKAKPSALAYLGHHLRTSLSFLLANVQLAIEQREEAKAAALVAINAPLAQPVAVFVAEDIPAHSCPR